MISKTRLFSAFNLKYSDSMTPQLPVSQNMQPDTALTDSAGSIISADSSFQIPNPSDYTIGDTFQYIWDLLQVQLFTLQNTPVTFLKLIIFILLLVRLFLFIRFHQTIIE